MTDERPGSDADGKTPTPGDGTQPTPPAAERSSDGCRPGALTRRPGLSASLVLSPRRRRLRITVAALSFCAVLGVCIGAVIYLRTRPTQYRPDEASSEIKTGLAR